MSEACMLPDGMSKSRRISCMGCSRAHERCIPGVMLLSCAMNCIQSTRDASCKMLWACLSIGETIGGKIQQVDIGPIRNLRNQVECACL